LIVLTAITLITLDYRAGGGGITGSIRNGARTALQPIGDAVDFVVTPVGNVIGGVLDFGRVRRENAKLRDELAQNRSAVAAADGGDMVMSLVEPNNDIHPGDDIVTSGLQQSEYPPGLPVGKVRSAKRDQGGLSQDVTVRPLVNLRRLSFVRVLQWAP